MAKKILEEETLLEKSLGLDVTIDTLDPLQQRVEGKIQSSSSKGSYYTASFNLREGVYHCTCPTHTYRPDKKCKHVIALMLEARKTLVDKDS